MIGIVGAGPAGSYTAYNLAKKGFDVKVFEEHPKIGEPVACTGITTHALENLVAPKKDILLTKITKIRVFAPNGNHTTIHLQKPDLVFDRGAYDRQIADMAHDAGAQFLTQHRFIAKEKNTISIKRYKDNTTTQYKVDNLVGADGPSSCVAKSVGLFGRNKYWVGVQATVKGEFDPENFDVYMGSVSPAMFAWVVPEDASHARAGLATPTNAANHFGAFLKRIGVDSPKICSKLGGLIPVYNPNIKTEKNGTYLIGDAATQVKATTGGGIVQSLIAAQALAQAIETKKSYELLWRSKLGKDLWFALKIRNTLNKFTDTDYNNLVAQVNNPKVQQLLATHDRDFAASLFPKLAFANPGFARFAPILFRKTPVLD